MKILIILFFDYFNGKVEHFARQMSCLTYCNVFRWFIESRRGLRNVLKRIPYSHNSQAHPVFAEYDIIPIDCIKYRNFTYNFLVWKFYENAVTRNSAETVHFHKPRNSVKFRYFTLLLFCKLKSINILHHYAFMFFCDLKTFSG